MVSGGGRAWQAGRVAVRAVTPHIVSMTYSSDDRSPRLPRSEPEILPPQPADDPRRERPSVWSTSHRVTFSAPGPLGGVLMLLGLGALAVLGVAFFLSLFLLWIPILGALAAGFVLAALLRRR
jgi:hypothetical protein